MRTWIRSMSVLVLLLGCGGDDDSDGHGSSISVGDQPWDPEMCSPAAQQMGQLPDGCTQREIDGFFDCLNTACESTLERCYGAEFRSGTFDGPCEELLACAVDCRCADSDCVASCPGAAECGACFSDYTCGSECDLPECTKAPLAAAGVDTSKDCDDLAACCATMTDASSRTNCNQIVTLSKMAGPSANTVCASQFTIFKVVSKAPQCQ